MKGAASPRVVLDTNVLISALLFRGLPGRLVPLWQERKIVLLVSPEILKEYIKVLSYPKFGLDEEEIKTILRKEVLPFVEPVRPGTRIEIIEEDPSDDKFLSLAVDGNAEFLVSGDSHLLGIKKYRKTGIVPIAKFLDFMTRS
jgi:hypothetical protein